MSSVRIAVVGLGSRGRLTAREAIEAGALAAVCDVDPVVLVDTARALGEVRAESDYLRLLAAPDVQAVALCTPPATWDGMVEAALHAGKDIYLDAPLVLPLTRGRALLDLVAERRRLLMSGPVLRFAPAVEALMALVRDGRLGTLRYLHGRHFKAAPTVAEPPADAGLSVTLGHLLADLVPSPPGRVLTRATTWRSARHPDVTETLLDFPGGPRVLLHAAALGGFGGVFELEIIGDRGAARLWRDAEDHLHLAVDADEAIDLPLPSSGSQARAASLRHFLDAVATRRPALQGSDGLLALWRLLAAAQRSLDAGAEVPFGPGAGAASTAPAPVAVPGLAPGVVLHPTVQVDGPCEIGEGTKIWHFSKLLGPLTIGRQCSFGQNVVIERHVTIGDNVKVQNNVSIYSGVILEDDVFCGPSMVFTNIGTPRSHYPRKGQYATTRVRRGASIGANATVVCGHTLGQYCFVGAGAVVTRDVPDFALVYGNPARVMGFTCYCGIRLPFGTGPGEHEEGACADCGRRYTRDGHVVALQETP